MALISNALLPASAYNALPSLSQSIKVRTTTIDHLFALKVLLAKHRVEKQFTISFLHKLLEVPDDHVVIGDKLPYFIPIDSGICMPVTTENKHDLHALKYLVDVDGKLQAYEYTMKSRPDMAEYTAFLEEFCHTIQERNLQLIYGLKLVADDESNRLFWGDQHFRQPFDEPLNRKDIHFQLCTDIQVANAMSQHRYREAGVSTHSRIPRWTGSHRDSFTSRDAFGTSPYESDKMNLTDNTSTPQSNALQLHSEQKPSQRPEEEKDQEDEHPKSPSGPARRGIALGMLVITTVIYKISTYVSKAAA